MDRAERGAEGERRARIVARSEMKLQAHGFRDHVRAFDDGLAELEAHDRRLVRILVSQLASRWIGLHGPSHRNLVAEVAVGAETLRVDAHCDPAVDEPEFWEELVSRQTEDVIAPWVLDRRGSSGVWFELPRDERA